MNTNNFHDNITAKLWIFKTYRALIYHRLYDSVAKRIKHEASGMFTYREKISNPVKKGSSLPGQP